jgi:hypothetical protein
MENRVSNFDLNSMMAQFVAYDTMKTDRERDTGESSDYFKNMCYKFLQASKPQLLRAAETVDSQKEMTLAIQARIQSQEAVMNQKVKDAGADKGVAMINDIIKQHVADANKE